MVGEPADDPSSRKVFLLFRSAASTSTTLMPSGLPVRSPIWRGDDLANPKISAACSAAANASPYQKRLSCAIGHGHQGPADRRSAIGRLRNVVSAHLACSVSSTRKHHSAA